MSFEGKMHILQQTFSTDSGWKTLRSSDLPLDNFQLVLAFSAKSLLEQGAIYKQIKEQFVSADILIASTAGEIADVQVLDSSISLVAIALQNSKHAVAVADIKHEEDSYAVGKKLATQLNGAKLQYVLVVSDGHEVNGSELVRGLYEHFPKNVIITGGLSGDGNSFKETLVGLNEEPRSGRVAAVGFYGDSITITYGSIGGWDSFGPERFITRSKDNILYELDHKPALDVYKLYLGDFASELPGSALLFPLSIRSTDSDTSLVRTILSIDEETKSLIFAGNMPEGNYARLMKANLDRLVEGANIAAKHSILGNRNPELAILISCVGRKLVLDKRIEEEIETVREVYGPQTIITGFYSYGEISPTFEFMKCELHNQTMTITTISED